MAIFSSLSRFFNKHRRKILISLGIGVSTYYLFQHFVVNRFRTFRSNLQQELFIKEQIKRRFIQTQNDCYYTLLALMPVLIEPIVSSSPIELITKALKLKKSNNKNESIAGSVVGQSGPEISDSLLTTDNLILHLTNDNELSSYLNRSKTDLWKLLKTHTLTRFLTLNYSICSLLLLTRLQLNILARKSYLQSAIMMTNKNSKVNDDKTQAEYFIEQSYLSLSWWLINKGWDSLNIHIELIVSEKFKFINARTELTIEEFNRLLIETINEINNNKSLIINSIWPGLDDLNVTLLNTAPSLINEYNESFVKLINETNLIINNEFFMNVFYDMLLSNVDTLNLTLNESPAHTKLANFLAQLSIQCEVLANNNHDVVTEITNSLNFNENELMGNPYVNNLNALDSLDEFSASIYSNIE